VEDLRELGEELDAEEQSKQRNRGISDFSLGIEPNTQPGRKQNLVEEQEGSENDSLTIIG
jgi:hypothetical protein